MSTETEGRKRMYVRPNERAQRLGLPFELEVGWIIACANGEDYYGHPWGSVRDEKALASLVADTLTRHPALDVVDLRDERAYDAGCDLS